MTIHSSSKVPEDDAETGCELLQYAFFILLVVIRGSSRSPSDLDSDFASFRQISIITSSMASTS